MECWFTTSDGNTLHNNPKAPNFVPGEPPKNPNISKIDYRIECIQKGIARCGWPNTGDMRSDPIGKGRLAPNGYSFESLSDEQRRYLREFSSILASDLIIIPANEDPGDVHIGIVLTPDKQFILPYLKDRTPAYYYFHDIINGDYYELAHRVNVKWAKDKEDEPVVVHLSGIRGVWRSPFSRVVQEHDKIAQYARKYGLFQAP